MRSLPAVFFLALALSVGGCGGDDAGGDGDGGVDAPAAHSIVGTWRALPSNFDQVPRPEAARNKLVFGADRSLVITTDGFVVNYDYATAGDLLTITPRAGQPDAHPEGIRYRIVGNTLLNYAKTPMNPIDGNHLANVWTEARMLDGGRYNVTWDLRADLSASVTYDTAGGLFAYDATWQERDGDLLLNVTDDQGNPVLFLARLLDGHLGVPYELLP